MKYALLLIIVFFLLYVPAPAQKSIVRDQKQVVEIAEKFVAENGYTNKTQIKRKKLLLEYGEKISDINNIVVSRFNLIQPYPVIALIKKIGEKSFWSVQFLYKYEKIEKQYLMGREVIISLDGRKIMMSPESVAIEEYVPIHGDEGYLLY